MSDVARILARHSKDLHFIDINSVLVDLMSENVFEHHEYHGITDKDLPTKHLFLQKNLPLKGDNAFPIFIKVLRQGEYKKLADTLEKEWKNAPKNGDEEPEQDQIFRDTGSRYPSQSRTYSKDDEEIPDAAAVNGSQRIRMVHSESDAAHGLIQYDSVASGKPSPRSAFANFEESCMTLRLQSHAKWKLNLTSANASSADIQFLCALCIRSAMATKEFEDIETKRDAFIACRTSHGKRFGKVNIGGGARKPFEKACREYVEEYYSMAGDVHYSLPSGLLLKDKEFDYLLSLAETKDLELPPDYRAKAVVFNRAKDICATAPSLVVADYKKTLIDEHEGSSPLLLIAGGSGTGKTIVVKERAKRLAKENPCTEVIVMNLPGGYLTKDFRNEFQGAKRMEGGN
ncbi:unnamed protein product [Darwinula stevensoni]|uniref:CARD domain-containing protein n=1 Tax=Darwinula stevensoni TaxID=69355 RepID=A0A7R8XB82_9CRUS|nr:unnamed protein product [Darwinula stevensoni]CAG0890996.1 unnamed protein product [Darwinula stevensoni]